MEEGRLKRTGEGVKNTYYNNTIKHFYKACHVAGTVLSTLPVLIRLILITTLRGYYQLAKEYTVYKALNYPVCQFPPEKVGQYNL